MLDRREIVTPYRPRHTLDDRQLVERVRRAQEVQDEAKRIEQIRSAIFGHAHPIGQLYERDEDDERC